jgi:hypothetical protein
VLSDSLSGTYDVVCRRDGGEESAECKDGESFYKRRDLRAHALMDQLLAPACM